MFSPRSSAAAELEAVTAERDFFKEKYAAHASEMEAMKTQLRESQRMVDKLRNQVLDLSQQVIELEGRNPSNCSDGKQGQAGGSKRPSLAESSSSTSTHNNSDNDTDASASDELASTPSKKQNAKGDENSEKENNDGNEDFGSEEENESGGESDNDSHDGDEAEAIRLKASRMLAWASYQSTRRTPSKTIDGNEDGSYVMETPPQPTGRPSAAYTVPTKIQSLLDDDEESDAASLEKPQQVASDSKVTTKGGKIGKFVSNMKDILGTQSESDSSYEDEDESSIGSGSECSNLSENLARMQLDFRHAGDQEE